MRQTFLLASLLIICGCQSAPIVEDKTPLALEIEKIHGKICNLDSLKIRKLETQMADISALVANSNDKIHNLDFLADDKIISQLNATASFLSSSSIVDLQHSVAKLKAEHRKISDSLIALQKAEILSQEFYESRNTAFRILAWKGTLRRLAEAYSAEHLRILSIVIEERARDILLQILKTSELRDYYFIIDSSKDPNTILVAEERIKRLPAIYNSK